MALVLAIEPDSKQAGVLKWMVEHRLHCEFVLTDSREAAVAALAEQIPDLVLVSALLSPRDEAEFSEHLRSLDGAEHLQTLTIPLLGSPDHEPEVAGRRLLGGFLRRRKAVAPAGCDPSVYADELRRYLKLAVEGRAERAAGLIWQAQLEAENAAIEAGYQDLPVDASANDAPMETWEAVEADAPVQVESNLAPVAQTGEPFEPKSIDQELEIEIIEPEQDAVEPAADPPVEDPADTPAPTDEDPISLWLAEVAPAAVLEPAEESSEAPVVLEEASDNLVERRSLNEITVESTAVEYHESAELPVIVEFVQTDSADAPEATPPILPEAAAATLSEGASPILPEAASAIDDELVVEHDEDLVVEFVGTAPIVDSIVNWIDTTVAPEPVAAAIAAEVDAMPVVEAVAPEESPAEEWEEPVPAHHEWNAVAERDPVAEELDLTADEPELVVDLQPEQSLDRVIEDLIRPFAASLTPVQSFTIESVDDPSIEPIVSRESARQVEPAPAPVERAPVPAVEAWMALPAWTEIGPPLASHISVGATTRPAAVAAQTHQPATAAQAVPAVEAASDPVAIDSRWIASALNALRSDIQLLRSERPAGEPNAATSSPPASAGISPSEPGARPDKAAAPKPRKKERAPAVHDEWGLYDPSQCGFEALLAAIDANEEATAAEHDGEVQPSATDLLMAQTSVQAPPTAGEHLVVTPSRRAGSIRLAPLAMWARIERESDPESPKPETGRRQDDLLELLAGLAIPVGVASVSYPTGCTIRRVRMTRDDQPRPPKAAEDPVIILSQRLLKKEREEREPVTRSGRR